MDTDQNNTDSPGTTPTERSAEEIAWDKEFEATSGNREFASTLGDLLSLAIKVPIALIQMPINMLPSDTRHHTRAAVREGFLAARSLVGALGDGIESMLADPDEVANGVSGPPGTWGHTRHAGGQSTAGASTGGGGAGSTGKVRRIELDADEPPKGEGRGLRADIDY